MIIMLLFRSSNSNTCTITNYSCVQVVHVPRDMLVSQELLESGALVKDAMCGVFVTREALDQYEQLWHCKIYQPSWTELHEKFTDYSSLWQNILFGKLRSVSMAVMLYWFNVTVLTGVWRPTTHTSHQKLILFIVF